MDISLSECEQLYGLEQPYNDENIGVKKRLAFRRHHPDKLRQDLGREPTEEEFINANQIFSKIQPCETTLRDAITQRLSPQDEDDAQEMEDEAEDEVEEMEDEEMEAEDDGYLSATREICEQEQSTPIFNPFSNSSECVEKMIKAERDYDAIGYFARPPKSSFSDTEKAKEIYSILKKSFINSQINAYERQQEQSRIQQGLREMEKRECKAAFISDDFNRVNNFGKDKNTCWQYLDTDDKLKYFANKFISLDGDISPEEFNVFNNDSTIPSESELKRNLDGYQIDKYFQLKGLNVPEWNKSSIIDAKTKDKWCNQGIEEIQYIKDLKKRKHPYKNLGTIENPYNKFLTRCAWEKGEVMRKFIEKGNDREEISTFYGTCGKEKYEITIRDVHEWLKGLFVRELVARVAFHSMGMAANLADAFFCKKDVVGKDYPETYGVVITEPLSQYNFGMFLQLLGELKYIGVDYQIINHLKKDIFQRVGSMFNNANRAGYFIRYGFFSSGALAQGLVFPQLNVNRIMSILGTTDSDYAINTFFDGNRYSAKKVKKYIDNMLHYRSIDQIIKDLQVIFMVKELQFSYFENIDFQPSGVSESESDEQFRLLNEELDKYVKYLEL